MYVLCSTFTHILLVTYIELDIKTNEFRNVVFQKPKLLATVRKQDKGTL